MRVIGASFDHRSSAEHVLAELTKRYELSETDAAIAPLVDPSRPDDERVILAGRFWRAVTGDVRAAIEAGGGTVVIDVAEPATRPRQRPERDHDTEPARSPPQGREGILQL